MVPVDVEEEVTTSEMVRSRSPTQPLAFAIETWTEFTMGLVKVLGMVSKTTTRGAVGDCAGVLVQVPGPTVPEIVPMPDSPKAHCCQKSFMSLGPVTKLPNGCAPTPLGSAETKGTA